MDLKEVVEALRQLAVEGRLLITFPDFGLGENRVARIDTISIDVLGHICLESVNYPIDLPVEVEVEYLERKYFHLITPEE